MRTTILALFLILTLTLKAQDKVIELHQYEGEQIVLPYAENDFVIKYVGLYYDAPKQVTYKYKMQGFHDDWQYVGTERTARFNNLASGDYTFLVKAANPDGIWTKEPSILQFKILKPWYWTWWAKLFYFFVLSTFLYFIYRSEHYRKLAERESERLEKIIAEGTERGNPAPLSDIDQSPSPSANELFLNRIRTHIEEHLDDSTYNVGDLAQDMNLSRQQLYRKTKALTGKSIASYVRLIRLHHGKKLLKTTEFNVSEVAYQVGFTDPSYFSKTYSQEFGYAPSEEG